MSGLIDCWDETASRDEVCVNQPEKRMLDAAAETDETNYFAVTADEAEAVNSHKNSICSTDISNDAYAAYVMINLAT